MHVESILEYYASKIRLRYSLYGFDWEENPRERLREWKKVSLSWQQNICTCVSEKEKSKLQALKLLQFFRHKICKFFIQKGFQKCRTSHQNMLYPLESVVKMTKETSKRDVERIRARVAKRASKYGAKAEVNLNWLGTIDMDCFDYILISTDDLTYLIPMLPMVSQFLYFLQHLLQDYKEPKTYCNHQFGMVQGSFFCLGKSTNLFRS